MKTWFTFIGLFALSTVIGFNCAQDKFQVLEDLNQTVASSSLVAERKLASYSVLTKEQVLESMLSVTGVEYNNSIRNTYEKTQGSFTLKGELGDTNAPMMLSLTSLAGEVCEAFVKQEEALKADQRPFLYEVDFSKGIENISQENINNIIRGFSRTFWGRAETPQEYDALLTLLDEFEGGQAQGQLDRANHVVPYLTTLCTTMLATPDFLYY